MGLINLVRFVTPCSSIYKLCKSLVYVYFKKYVTIFIRFSFLSSLKSILLFLKFFKTWVFTILRVEVDKAKIFMCPQTVKLLVQESGVKTERRKGGDNDEYDVHERKREVDKGGVPRTLTGRLVVAVDLSSRRMTGETYPVTVMVREGLDKDGF